MKTRNNPMEEFIGSVSDDNRSERTSLEPDNDQIIDQKLDNNDISAYEEVARQYFSAKDRLKYFACVTTSLDFGKLSDSDSDSDSWIAYYSFTEEQLSKIKQFIKEDDGVHVSDDGSNYQVFPDPYDLSFEEYPEGNEILGIDVDNIYYRYRMSCASGEMVKEFTVELSDAEYIYLLAHELAARPFYTFNCLLSENPKLACKINDAALETLSCGGRQSPFAIIFNEIREDAYTIDGLEPAGTFFSEDITGDRVVQIRAYAGRHKLTLIQEVNSCDEGITDCYTMNADEMMKYLGETNYEAMINRLEEFTITGGGVHYINVDFLKSTGIEYYQERSYKDYSEEFDKFLKTQRG